MKKYSIKISVILLIVTCFFLTNINVYADVLNKSYVDITSPSALVMDFTSGRVLYEKAGYEKRAMASLTKVMTSIMLVENCKMDELIEVPAEATWQGGSEVGLKKGDKVTAEALLYGMLLPSGNDCAYTVAIHIGGTVEIFAKLMSEKAWAMGAKDTNFVTPHGLDSAEHYSTAYDMALITRYALKNKYINDIVNTVSHTVNFGSFTKTLSNTNALLRTYAEIDGVKTGFTNDANRCLIASETKGDFRIIAVILGAETTQNRFGDAKKLLDSTFERYKLMDISSYMNFYIKIPVYKGEIAYYEAQASDNMILPLTQEEYDSIYIKQQIMPSITPPVLKGMKVGDIGLYIDSEKIYETEIFLDRNIEKKGVLGYITDGIIHMFDQTRII